MLAGLGAALLPASVARAGGAPAVSLRPVMRPPVAGNRPVVDLDALIEAAGPGGEVACAVAEVATGRVLESVRAGRGLPPASVAKTLTALYALEALGAGHRFRTRLMVAGAVENGRLEGDLILAGGGDPTLDTDGLADLAAQLKAAGIREVTGRFAVYDGLLPYIRSIDPTQPDHLAYSPAVSGIALNYNRVYFQWKRNGRGHELTLDARTRRYRPEVRVARIRVADRARPIYTYDERGGVDMWTVAGRALGRGGSRWLPVRNPALYAGDVFATLARAHGIVLKPAQVMRRLPGAAREVGARESRPLREILRLMLKYSNNLTAEMVGMAASRARGRNPRTLAESARAMNAWAASAWGMTGTKMVDHSGLEDASRMTPRDLVGLLVRVREKGLLRPLLKPLPVLDDKGRPLRDVPIRVDAKTGTLNFVSALGGFITAADGRELAFAIFAADPARRARIDRAERERPPGARAWSRKARRLQHALLRRWGTMPAQG